jgi:hypothetical protein
MEQSISIIIFTLMEYTLTLLSSQRQFRTLQMLKKVESVSEEAFSFHVPKSITKGKTALDTEDAKLHTNPHENWVW